MNPIEILAKVHQGKRMQSLLHVVIFTLFGSYQDKWYEDFTPIVKDRFSLGIIQLGADKPQIEPFKRIGWKYASSGKVYAILESSEFQEMKTRVVKVGQHKLETDADAKAISDFVGRLSEGIKIPFVVKVAFTPIPGGKTAIGTAELLGEFVNSQSTVLLKTAKELSSRIVKGGTFTTYRTVKELKDQPGKHVVHTSCVYDVIVGKDNYSYLVYESIVAVKVE